MLYEYSCPECSWQGTRICKVAERDQQFCERQIAATLPGQEQLGLCGGKLKREEISVNSKMSNQWSRWSGHTD